MRNQWLRLLVLRCHTPSQRHISQVNHLRSFTSSLLQARAPHAILTPFPPPRHFTSSPEPAVELPKPPSDLAAMITELFSTPEMSNDEIKTDLDAKNVTLTHDLVLSVLKNPDIDHNIAKRIFNWVSENESKILSSNSYNMMLGILGGNGFVKESWELIGVMKKKGYGVKKDTFLRISDRFMKDGASDDVEKLKDLYASGSARLKNNAIAGGGSVVSDSIRVSEIIRSQVWGDDVEKQLKALDVEFSSDLITRVLQVLEVDPNKALIFFRWIEDSDVKHDQQTYNALARVLGKEDHSEKFWRFIDEMRQKGHEMERETYMSLSKQFLTKKLIQDAANLYEIAMSGSIKPSVEDCTLLLKKIVVSKDLDMDSFQKVVQVFHANGNAFTDNILDAVIKSLISVGRMNECNRALAVTMEAGYVPSDALKCKIAFKLGSFGETAKGLEFMDKMMPCSQYTDWASSLVKGFCEEPNLDGATRCVEKMVEKLGRSVAGRPLAVLVGTYCQKGRPLRAYKLVSKMVKDKGVVPWHSTYKTLTRRLLARKHFKEALDVMIMMKMQDYPADLDSFTAYLSKKGTVEEAVTFTERMTSKRFPATPVFLRLFGAYLKAQKLSEAHEFLARCPSHIKNHADILNLFSSKASAATKNADVAV